MNDIWNEICFELRACIQNNVLEKEYENAVCNCLLLLGWKKSRGEIVTQCPVQVGHENKYADIVVLQDNVEQFVIEVKRPSHLLQEEDEKQLFSYMRLLEHQVVYGLYVGDKIRLYYDDITSQQFPELVLSIEIEEDNSDGMKFVELFSRDLFNVQTLTGFCKKQKEKIKEHRQIQIEVDRLLSETNGQSFKDALKRGYIEGGHSEQWADSVLNQITLTVSPLVKITTETRQSATSVYKPIQTISTRDKTKGSYILSYTTGSI